MTSTTNSVKGGANTTPQLKDIEDGPPPRPGPTPFHAFRKWRTWLSVTDLVQPTWCEMLYDYALRSQSFKRPEDRPPQFKSADGRWIRLDKGVAAANCRVTSRGRAIHKKLERQASLRAADIQLPQPNGHFERWGLHLVQMLECLATLKETGLSREMPVFGIIDGNVVFGQIDNLVLKESGHITQKTPKASDDSSQKKRKATTSPTESTKRARISSDGLYPRPTELDSEVDSTHSERPHNVAAQDVRYTVHISDTKTRTTPDLPPEEDAVSHHLQLMLYHRLLSGLLVNSEATGCASTMTNGTGERVQSLNFADLWRRLSLDPQRPFSNMFIRSARQLLERGKAGAPQFECLDDLVRLWHKAVEDLSVDGVDSTLTLEYSLQTLEGAGDNNPGFASQPQVAPPTPHEKTMDDGILSQESETTLAGTSQGSDTTQVGDEDSESTEMLQTASLPKGLLGVKKFQVDDQRLDAHLRSILRWWHGQRRPKGVTKELERRCETCEYHLDCEWKAKKS